MSRLAALALLLPLAPLAAAQDELAPPTTAAAEEKVAAAETSWALLALGDERVGTVRTSSEEVETDAGPGTRSRSVTKMVLRRFGQELRISIDLTADAGPDGSLRGFTLRTENPGSAPTTVVGTRDGDELALVTTVNGVATTKFVELPPNLKTPAYVDELIRGGLEPGESARFETFFPDLGQVGTVTVTRGAGPQTVELPNGETRDLTPIVVAQDALPFPATVYVDSENEAVLERMELFGSTLTTYEVTEEEALGAIFSKSADIGFDTLVEVRVIPGVHTQERVTYEVAVEGADAAELFPQTDAQKVEPLDGGRARVTALGLPVPAAATAGEAPDFLKATRYLQTDDPNVSRHAAAAAPAGATAGEIALGCAAYVSRTLTDKNFSTALASAAEVAENLSGDCTEHSVLCAAMLRARGVPSRACVGLVTLPGRGQMGGHMWVEAYLDADGPGAESARWVPLDPTITGGGVGGGHLLLAVSDLDDAGASPVASFVPMLEVVGRLTVEVVAP